MIKDATLGGYFEVHERPPAFTGTDGRAYSVAVYVSDQPDEDGRFGAALLFVQWSESGDRPEGHLETDYLAFGETPAAAEASLRSLSLYDVKQHLDRLVNAGTEQRRW